MGDKRLSNWPHPDRIESWQWRPMMLAEAESSEEFADVQTVEQLAQFDLEDHWRRGGYKPSLLADGEGPSESFRTDLLRDFWDWLPEAVARVVPQGRFGFARMLANHNGHSLATLRKKVACDGATFEMLRRELVTRDIVFELPFRPVSINRGGVAVIAPPTEPLFYFRDTGILHTALQLTWPPDTKRHKHYDRSWEGFVVQALSHTIGAGSAAQVWRQSKDEIDLVLSWPDRRPWAIEIGRGTDKRVSEGFHAGIALLKVERAWVVHKGQRDTQNGVQRTTLEGLITEIGNDMIGSAHLA